MSVCTQYNCLVLRAHEPEMSDSEPGSIWKGKVEIIPVVHRMRNRKVSRELSLLFPPCANKCYQISASESSTSDMNADTISFLYK